MPVEFIGMISTRDQSETRRASGPVIDRDYLRRFARAHEDAGFDRVLIGYGSSQPDGIQVAAYAASQTDRLGFLIAHRPGFVFPTLAARTFATLDQFAGGRIAVHIITGGSDAEQRRDGDFLDKDSRYARTDEYLDILKRAWTSDGPFDYDGQYYQLEDFYADIRSPQQPRIPLYFGGSSDAAYRVGGKHADVFALWGEPLAETAEQIASVRQSAAANGRSDGLGISVSFRPILGPTEDLAWERAHRSWKRPNTTSALSGVSGGGRRLAWVAPDPKTWGRSGCWPRRRKGSFTTEPCGLLWQPPRAQPETPPLWSVRPRRLLKPSSTTSTSASPRCSSAATTPMTTPSTTGATCSRWSGMRRPGANSRASAPAVTAAPALTPAEGTGLFES